jgi:putative transposase
MSSRDIQSFLREKYEIDVSPEFISSVTESVSAGVQEWRTRPWRRSGRSFIWTPSSSRSVRKSGLSRKPFTSAVGVNLDGNKELLGLWLGPERGPSSTCNHDGTCRSPGLEDVFIACVDGLKGLPEAIESIFPQATIQTCVVHLVRHSLSFVNYKDRKMVAADLQLVYQASTEAEALQALEQFQIKSDKEYPVIFRSWRANWARVKPMFELPMEIRRVVYTTNVIESLNFSLRKIIKGRNVLPER